MTSRLARIVLVAALAVAGGAGVRAAGRAARWFADRPVAWVEHDDGNVPTPPEANHIQDWSTTLDIRDSLQNEADRVLALEKDEPARGFIIEQDREIAEKSGRPPLPIKSIRRAGAKRAVAER